MTGENEKDLEDRESLWAVRRLIPSPRLKLKAYAASWKEKELEERLSIRFR